MGLGGGWREALPLLGVSLILGTPQVLALPAPFASDGLSLALSSLLPVVSLAGLFGVSVAAAKGGGGCRERLVACAGLAATAIYLALSWWVVLSWSWGAGVASLGVAATFVLDVMGMAAAGIGMFGCCYMACDGARRHGLPRLHLRAACLSAPWRLRGCSALRGAFSPTGP